MQTGGQKEGRGVKESWFGRRSTEQSYMLHVRCYIILQHQRLRDWKDYISSLMCCWTAERAQGHNNKCKGSID